MIEEALRLMYLIGGVAIGMLTKDYILQYLRFLLLLVDTLIGVPAQVIIEEVVEEEILQSTVTEPEQ